MPHRFTHALREQHICMLRILTLIRVHAKGLHTDDAHALQVLTKAVGYMNGFPTFIHHPNEDAMFARLAEADSALRETCDHLHQQHAAFSELEMEMLHHLGRAQAGDRASCALVRDIGATYCRDHAEHISVEEEVIIPRALEVLQREDWKAVTAAAKIAIDPVFGPEATVRYGNLYAYLLSQDPDPEIKQ